MQGLLHEPYEACTMYSIYVFVRKSHPEPESTQAVATLGRKVFCVHTDARQVEA